MTSCDEKIFEVDNINQLSCEKSVVNSEVNFSNIEDVFINKTEVIGAESDLLNIDMCCAEEVIEPSISANEKSLDSTKDNEEDPDNYIDIVNDTSLQNHRYSIESFENNPKAVLEFTGLENYVQHSLFKSWKKFR